MCNGSSPLPSVSFGAVVAWVHACQAQIVTEHIVQNTCKVNVFCLLLITHHDLLKLSQRLSELKFLYYPDWYEVLLFFKVFGT